MEIWAMNKMKYSSVTFPPSIITATRSSGKARNQVNRDKIPFESLRVPNPLSLFSQNMVSKYVWNWDEYRGYPVRYTIIACAQTSVFDGEFYSRSMNRSQQLETELWLVRWTARHRVERGWRCITVIISLPHSNRYNFRLYQQQGASNMSQKNCT